MTRLFTMVAAVATIAVTAAEGAPNSLPPLALDSPLLFHLERIVALLSVLMVILLILHRASTGQLPIELSMQGIKYSETQPDEDAIQSLISDTQRIRQSLSRLERRVGDIEGEA